MTNTRADVNFCLMKRRNYYKIEYDGNNRNKTNLCILNRVYLFSIHHAKLNKK